MPLAPVIIVKTLVPSLLSKQDTTILNCLSLYQAMMTKLNTNRVSLTVRGVAMNNNSMGYSIQTPASFLPKESRPVSDFCPTIHEYFELKVEYSDDHLLPAQKMTRAEFVMELLDIWEESHRGLATTALATAGKRLEEAAETLRNTYTVRELANLDYLESVSI